MQSCQSLCLSLEYSMIIKSMTEHHLEFLSINRGCTTSSESIHVKIPHSWKSHVMSHLELASILEIYCNVFVNYLFFYS